VGGREREGKRKSYPERGLRFTGLMMRGREGRREGGREGGREVDMYISIF